MQTGKLQGASAYGRMILALRCLELCMFGSEVSNFRSRRAVFKLFIMSLVAGILCLVRAFECCAETVHLFLHSVNLCHMKHHAYVMLST